MTMSFIGRLQQKRDELRAQQADPWYVRLDGARGKIGDDGVERVSTQTLFDILEIPQRGRTAAAARRVAAIMRQLGWTAVKARGLTPGGFKDQVRGYARVNDGSFML
jgi:hypothetical protein